MTVRKFPGAAATALGMELIGNKKTMSENTNSTPQPHARLPVPASNPGELHQPAHGDAPNHQGGAGSGLRGLIAATPAYPATLLDLCSVPGGHGAQLLADNPALVVLAAHSVQSLPWGERSGALQRLATLPWRQLLAHLGLPARLRTLRLLGKVPRDHCRPQSLEVLQRMLAGRPHRWVHVLPHLPRITRDTIGLLRLDPSLVTPNLLQASAESDSDVETVTWLLTSIRTSLLRLGHRGPWPYSGLGVEKLKLVEGELFARLSPDHAVFPAPPFAGRPGRIEPLRDFFALAEEATGQANCVALLLPAIMGGEAFVYAVHAPERATLALRREHHLGDWEIQEIRARNNAAPAPGTVASLRAWLDAEKSKTPEN